MEGSLTRGRGPLTKRLLIAATAVLVVGAAVVAVVVVRNGDDEVPLFRGAELPRTVAGAVVSTAYSEMQAELRTRGGDRSRLSPASAAVLATTSQFLDGLDPTEAPVREAMSLPGVGWELARERLVSDDGPLRDRYRDVMRFMDPVVSPGPIPFSASFEEASRLLAELERTAIVFSAEDELVDELEAVEEDESRLSPASAALLRLRRVRPPTDIFARFDPESTRIVSEPLAGDARHLRYVDRVVRIEPLRTRSESLRRGVVALFDERHDVEDEGGETFRGLSVTNAVIRAVVSAAYTEMQAELRARGGDRSVLSPASGAVVAAMSEHLGGLDPSTTSLQEASARGQWLEVMEDLRFGNSVLRRRMDAVDARLRPARFNPFPGPTPVTFSLHIRLAREAMVAAAERELFEELAAIGGDRSRLSPASAALLRLREQQPPALGPGIDATRTPAVVFEDRRTRRFLDRVARTEPFAARHRLLRDELDAVFAGRG